MSAREIASEVIGVKSPASVHKLADAGIIPRIRVTKNIVRYDPDAVRDALKKLESPTN